MPFRNAYHFMRYCSIQDCRIETGLCFEPMRYKSTMLLSINNRVCGGRITVSNLCGNYASFIQLPRSNYGQRENTSTSKFFPC